MYDSAHLVDAAACVTANLLDGILGALKMLEDPRANSWSLPVPRYTAFVLGAAQKERPRQAPRCWLYRIINERFFGHEIRVLNHWPLPLYFRSITHAVVITKNVCVVVGMISPHSPRCHISSAWCR